MEENLNKIEPNVWKPTNDGDELVGIFITKEKGGQYNNWIYHFETKKDNKTEQVTVFGTTVLIDRMSYVKEGSKVKIVNKGMQPNKKGQDTKIFDVFTTGKPGDDIWKI